MRLLLFFLFFLFVSQAHAAYVLPYPAFMPGHKLYRVTRFLDEIKQYWYWGSIAQTKYHQGLSDKYLVEAKTLFEYKQYPLAIDALRRSDEQFGKISGYSIQAATAHRTVLTKLISEIPEVFVWQDEDMPPITLNIGEALKRSVELRHE